MIIKSYKANSASEALKLVRSELGGEAVVLKTRPVTGESGGRLIEVTACIEKTAGTDAGIQQQVPIAPPETRDVPAATKTIETTTVSRFDTAVAVDQTAISPDRLAHMQRTLDRLMRLTLWRGPTRVDDRIERLLEALRDADLPHEFIEEFIADCFQTYGVEPTSENILTALVEKLSGLMVPALVFKPGDRVLFAGLPGSGKTSAMGKLAAHLVMKEKRKVELMTLDNAKIGALDEIFSYGDLLDIEVRNSGAPQPPAENDKGSDKVLLIDTPALFRQSRQLPKLQDKITDLNPIYRFVTVSAMSRSADLSDLCDTLETVEPTHLIMTMTDLCSRFGSVVALSQRTGAKLALITGAYSGTGSMAAPDPALIARRMLGLENRYE
jgi:flagellar biosynthesis protein FlhF